MHRPRYRQMLAPRDGDGAVVVPACELSPSSQDYWELRIASIFIIFVGSAVGALLPIVLARSARMRVPKLCFFVAKYFGTGVILATAWMHLLSPASDNLRDECLADILPDYDWAMAIGLMTVMVIQGLPSPPSPPLKSPSQTKPENSSSPSPTPPSTNDANFFSPARIPILPNDVSYPPGGTDHLGHNREHTEGDAHSTYAAQITALFILEFGVIFHSVFIGLTLAVTDNFIVLFIVLVFHQTFEGLGLGARLAMARWPERGRRWTPYALGGLYAVSTPFAIGMGLVARRVLVLEAERSRVVNGVFDAVSGGILMYTGLVELVAHEFMFNPEMRKAGLGMQLLAYGCIALGVGLMALLAKWA